MDRGAMTKTLRRVKCPVCGAKFKYSHVCRELPNHPCITREWALFHTIADWVRRGS